MDGDYLKTVSRDHSVNPMPIRWCFKTSSLIVAERKQTRYYLVGMKVARQGRSNAVRTMSVESGDSTRSNSSDVIVLDSPSPTDEKELSLPSPATETLTAPSNAASEKERSHSESSSSDVILLDSPPSDHVETAAASCANVSLKFAGTDYWLLCFN